MKRPIRRALAIALCALALPLAGCDLSFITVRIPDFDSKKIEGIWISRRSETSGSYVHDTKISFQGVQTVAGREILAYITTFGPLGERGSLTAGVTRDPQSRDSVTLNVGFLRLTAPGAFKVSTFNRSGESALSTATKQL